MNRYVAFLRGINVGGKNIIKMAELKSAVEQAGFTEVRTFIQSGNLLLSSSEADTTKLAKQLEKVITARFGVIVPIVVFSETNWTAIVDSAPDDWESDPDWKYNVLILLPGAEAQQIRNEIGQLKPGIETLIAGNGVLYQAMSRQLFGKTTTGKSAGTPAYQHMTVRSASTCRKLLALLEKNHT